MRVRTRHLAGAAVAVVALTGPASGDGLCDCQARCGGTDPRAGLSYEDEEHRLWYEVRFWTGECDGALWWCWPGPSWYDVMDEVLTQTAEDSQPEACRRLFGLGIRLGHEWARDNAIRRIHTEDLKSWQAVLLESEDPMRAIADVEALVASRIK